MNLLLVFLHEGVRVCRRILVSVLLSSSVHIPACLTNVGCAAVMVICLNSQVITQPTLHLIANIASSTRATFSPASHTSYAVVVCV